MRRDLLALDRAAIVALANLGLVKRAEREIAEGLGPTIEERDDGEVTGRFADGVVATLPAQGGLEKARCSCGAIATCRHRVAVALAYPAYAKVREASVDAAPKEAWNPGSIDDDALARALGKRTLERAHALVRGGIIAEIARADATAKLSTCTVRFLVPNDLAYARCDCAATSGCEHVAIAVWAFRRAGDVARATVELGGGAPADLDPLDEAMELARLVIDEGAVHVGADVAPRFVRAHAALERAHFTWPSVLLDEIEASLEAYRSRSARYRPSSLADAIASLAARARVADRERKGKPGELPARYVLGADVARDTALDHARLVAIGARVEASGDEVRADVYLVDPDHGSVLVLTKSWSAKDAAGAVEGSALARRSVVPKVTLGALAAGQLVSKALKRRANRAITIVATRTAQTSVTPQSGAWDELPRRILVDDYATLVDASDSTPKLLAPRTLADGVRVVKVASVKSIGWSAAEQALVAKLVDRDGHELVAIRRHHRAAPHAIDALAAALRAPRFVSGEITSGASGLVLDPIAVVPEEGGVVVPDLAGATTPPSLPSTSLPRADAPLDDALDRARGLLAEAAHVGLSLAPSTLFDRAREAGKRLEALGLARAANTMNAFAEARTFDAWASAMIRASLYGKVILP